MGALDRIANAWNALRDASRLEPPNRNFGGMSSSYRPHVARSPLGGEKTIIASIHTRIAIDVAQVGLRHVKLDDKGRYQQDMDSNLNRALTIEPNLDQGPTAFHQDIVHTMFDHAAAAIVPVKTNHDPNDDNDFDIFDLRVGRVTAWYPHHVRVSIYNEDTALREEIILAKRFVAIVENPLANVMNEPNSTMKRLIRKLSILDVIDEASSSGKLDLIIQVPYVVKSETQRLKADQRRTDLESQLKDSKYGVAYADGNEKIIQLNRPVENNMMTQVEYLTKMLYGQLGITEDIMNGTADESHMINYNNRTIDPINQSIIEAMTRSFLGPVTRRKKERIMYFRNAFKFATLKDLAEATDILQRNKVMTSNESRQVLGLPPIDDPSADKLENANMPQEGETASAATPGGEDQTALVNSAFDEIDSTLDTIFSDLGASDE